MIFMRKQSAEIYEAVGFVDTGNKALWEKIKFFRKIGINMTTRRKLASFGPSTMNERSKDSEG